MGYEDQMNLYAYVGNDPINMIDPTGEVGLGTVMLYVAVGAVLVYSAVDTIISASDAVETREQVSANEQKAVDNYQSTLDAAVSGKDLPPGAVDKAGLELANAQNKSLDAEVGVIKTGGDVAGLSVPATKLEAVVEAAVVVEEVVAPEEIVVPEPERN